MVLIKERIGKLLENLNGLIYPREMSVSSYKMLRTAERFADVAGLDTSGWPEFRCEQLWGGHREYYWFETVVTVPEEFNDQCVIYQLITGREGLWDATNPQFSLFVNGRLVQGMDVNHTEAVLTEKARAGETFRIVLSAFTGDQNFGLRLDSKLRVLDRKTEKYYYDLQIPFEVAKRMPPDSAACITILSCLNESLNLLDLRREYSPEYYATLEKAQDYITGEFYGKHCGNSEAKIYCVGHTHIDVAWLWTLAVTEDKAVRSFSTVLELMREYPEYIFMSSQPQLYKYVKQNAPDIYARIKERVAEGRWEVEGGMWLEADCNIASGEALVRQFVHGKRFFREEFGKESEILWLPDVFGYSAALPQIMEKCGIRYFMTTKISWSEFNKMPCDTFQWEGIDGTRVLTHFIPARDFVGAGTDKAGKPSYEHEYFTTYNGELCPSQVMGGWQRYQQKNVNSEALMSFGYGDGGGGPTREMLENHRRMEKGIPGCPQTVMSTSLNFFRALEKNVSDSKYLPSWVGELYLEYHRGTYTSMARNKKYNRRSEFAYQNAELYGVLNTRLTGADYPREALYKGWEVLLRNQFHDILPGSSIQEVYDDSKAEYESILQTAEGLAASALGSIAAQVKAPRRSVVVYNPNSGSIAGIASFNLPQGMKNPVVYDGEKDLATQVTECGKVLFVAEGVPSKGYKTFSLREGPAALPAMEATPARMENRFFSIRFNEKGQFSSIFDKAAGRELLQPGKAGNVIMSYEDRPHNYDAWDVNNYYTEKSWEIDNLSEIKVVENGPVRATVAIERPYLESTITQFISIYTDIPRIDIRNEIDWKEKQIFVKVLFPMDIHANEATFDIQYGNVKRPTHANTSWDFAKFEVCVHKWLDISEHGYGVSVLNDCKYGCSVRDGVVGLSMLKSAIYPNPEADKEHHTFTYAIYPHSGDWRSADTVSQAYELNNPLTAVVKENNGGALPACYSLVSCDCENAVIEVIKEAEDGDGLIVRLYECYNRRTWAGLRFARPIASVAESDLLEENPKPLDFAGDCVTLSLLPYEIKTLRVCLQ